MSVKHSLLVLLSTEPMYGAQLRQEFESRTGGTWPLNVGQVYTTLGRLERDGLVQVAGEADDEGRIAYSLTEAGRAEVAAWWASPVERESTPRQELAIKLALAVTVPDVDVPSVVQNQRTATMTHLRDLTRVKAGAGDDLAWGLVVENLIFTAEAEIRWLDHVEARLARVGVQGRSSSRATPVAAADRAQARR